MDSPQTGDVAALERAFAAEGLALTVEARGRLAVVRPASSMAVDSGTRRRLVSLARQHGFTNLAVELAAGDADLPRD